ncbi:hypothetical protein QQS21_012762, partial [Conoideocrella luteorostrata]
RPPSHCSNFYPSAYRPIAHVSDRHAAKARSNSSTNMLRVKHYGSRGDKPPRTAGRIPMVDESGHTRAASRIPMIDESGQPGLWALGQ